MSRVSLFCAVTKHGVLRGRGHLSFEYGRCSCMIQRDRLSWDKSSAYLDSSVDNPHGDIAGYIVREGKSRMGAFMTETVCIESM